MIRRIVPLVAIALILAGLVGGFLATGSPQQRRAIALDDVRSADLRDIVRSVSSHYGGSEALPRRLETTGLTSGGRAYDYEKIDAAHYRLCATFSFSSTRKESEGDSNWDHPSGRACFTFVAGNSTPIHVGSGDRGRIE